MTGRLPDAVDEDGRPAPTGGEVLGPLPAWAVAAVFGILVGEAVALRVDQVIVLGTVAGAVGVVAAVLAVVLHRREAPALLGGVLGTVVVVAVGIAGVALRVDSTDRGLLPVLAQQGGTVDLRATVVHEPRPTAAGWHVLVVVGEVAGVPTRERAALTLDADPPPLGSRWLVRASARPLPDGGYGRWLARQHATVALDVGSWRPAAPAGVLSRSSEHVRARVRDAADRYLADGQAGLLAGFVTGDTRRLPEDDAVAMRATGLTHLVAVSGSNVAIVVGGVLGACVVLRFGARGRRRAVAATVVWFAFVTRFEPSVLRAGTMALLVLLASARGVPRDARHALAGAVLVLVLVDPLLAGSLGLLLSATATAGVLAVAPRVRERLDWLPRRVADLASITIGAQVAVVPILLATFGEVSLASVPANLIAVPAAAVSAVIGFVGCVAALLHLEVGAWLFWLAGQPARVVLWSAHTFDGVGGTARLGAPTTVLALLSGCGWLLSRPRSRGARATAWASAVLVVLVAVPLATGRFVPVSELTVTAIDVGQGDAFLVESPGARVLVDAGSDDTAASWLAANGRSRLDLVVATHPHLDHLGGIPDVLQRGRVAALWYRPVPTELPEAAEVLHAARERGVPVRGPQAGEVAIVGDLVVEVLGPPPGRPYQWSGSELNDTSIVVRVTWQDRRVLFSGDAEHAAQADLLGAPEKLEAELFTVPHHGAATSDPDFLRAVGAQVGLIGVGEDNRYGHPAPEVIHQLDALGIEVFRTDRDGTTRVPVPAPRPSPVPAALATVPFGTGADSDGVAPSFGCELPGDRPAGARLAASIPR